MLRIIYAVQFHVLDYQFRAVYDCRRLTFFKVKQLHRQFLDEKIHPHPIITALYEQVTSSFDCIELGRIPENYKFRYLIRNRIRREHDNLTNWRREFQPRLQEGCYFLVPDNTEIYRIGPTLALCTNPLTIRFCHESFASGRYSNKKGLTYDGPI